MRACGRLLSHVHGPDSATQYDDGEKEYRVEKDNVRAADDGGASGADTPEPSLREGDRCEGNHRGRGRWYPGRIGRVHANGTYDIDYDDGEQERRVDAVMARPVGGTAPEYEGSYSFSSATASFRSIGAIAGIPLAFFAASVHF